MVECAVVGCKPDPGASFHYLPKHPAILAKWLEFIYRHQAHMPTNLQGLRICHAHFSEECFHNFMPRLLGFHKKLLLKADAVPTVRPAAAAAGGGQASTSSSDPSTMERIGKNIACQQASLQVQNSRTTMVQLVSPAGIVLLTPTLPMLPLFVSSSDLISPALLGRPSGRPSDLPTARCSESESKTNSVACQYVNLRVQEKGTYMYTRPTRTKSKGIQVKVRCKDADVNANEKRLAKLESSETQHVIDEESILELLKYCPKCNRQCRCTKKTKGVYFIVNQSCYFCEYRRKWANQPEAKDIPISSCRRKQQKKKRPQLDKVSVNISIQPSDLKECYVVLGHPCPIPNDQ
ncbi:uncharacterized protein LOC130113409 [Lampris incognitus]|uniref:uncharacterized protein LOC130113409 n=1 Tax=Lampris incognitus TaxID=2546036 RepID=UPI0024B4AC9A|nr:uncharacterized protein LOC130113409 [Lampris incognitus]